MSEDSSKELEAVGADPVGPEKKLQTRASLPVNVAGRMTNEDAIGVFEKSESEFDQRFNAGISTVSSQEAGVVKRIDIEPADHDVRATIFLAPGWLDTLAANKYLIRSLVELGYRVVSLEHGRLGGAGKKADKRRVAALKTVIDSADFRGGKVYGVAASLGAIDLAGYADPEVSKDAHGLFKDFILLNPAGLNVDKGAGVRGLKHLVGNYSHHMKQAKSTDVEDGLSQSAISRRMREKMKNAGMASLKTNPLRALDEAFLVGGRRVQAEFQRLRALGHKVFVFSSEKDQLLPAREYELKVAAEKSGLNPSGENLQYGAGQDAHVDDVITLEGHHNTFRGIDRRDFQNEQWMSILWLDALIRHQNGEKT